jgi:Na+-transporting NADH:ubiquinone oxidoreductase subunit F
MVAIRRDYSLTGEESRRAADKGLVEAEWYRPALDADRLHELMARTNARAARDTTLWLALLAAAGIWAWFSLGSWWAVPAFVAYGTLYGSSADPRWHEMGHGTAFRTGWLNDIVYYLASFMLLRGPTLWRWSHVRHHTDTIVVGRDPEIIFPRPVSRWTVISTFLGLRVVPPMVWQTVKHTTGRLDDDTRDFVPEDEQWKVVWEARAFIAILVGVVVWCLTAGSIVPALYIGLPSLYGVWLLVFFGLTQHAGLQEDVLDHRLNTRTVHMNPIFRFLYSNMNYHVEHHIFPTVPYHSLPALHEEVKDQLAPALPSSLAAYREIFTALRRQAEDVSYELEDRGIPAGNGGTTRRPDVGAYIWATTHDDGRVDLGPADLEVGQVRRLDVADRSFALYRLAEDEYALTDGVCTHGQAHLAEGLVIDCSIECPKHNGRFDIRTGEPQRRPVKIPLATYDVEAVDGRIVSTLVARSGEEVAV